MSTLAEIEAAAEALSPEDKEHLLRFLARQLKTDRPQTAPRVFSNEELATMLAEDEADLKALNAAKERPDFKARLIAMWGDAALSSTTPVSETQDVTRAVRRF
jgi:uncharacterized membrane protein